MATCVVLGPFGSTYWSKVKINWNLCLTYIRDEINEGYEEGYENGEN